MKKYIILIVITMIAIHTTYAQKIEIQKGAWGYSLIQNGKSLTKTELDHVFAKHKEALALLKSSRNKSAWGAVLGAVGGGLVGWPIGTAIGGGDANWALAGVGAGFIAIAIPISSKSTKQLKESVALYNESLPDTAYRKSVPQLSITGTANGIGLQLNF